MTRNPNKTIHAPQLPGRIQPDTDAVEESRPAPAARCSGALSSSSSKQLPGYPGTWEELYPGTELTAESTTIYLLY